MAVPKKNINIKPEKEGHDLRYKYFNDVNTNNGFLPQTITPEDLDLAVFDFIKNTLGVTIQRRIVPSVFLTIQRWTEYTKTWEFLDKNKNIKIPFISVIRMPEIKLNEKEIWWKIPERKTFPFLRVPSWDGNKKGFTIYKIPQPVPIELNYEVRFLCHRMRDINKFASNLDKQFVSRQKYIFVKGHPFPLTLEGNQDNSQKDGFDDKRFYMQKYDIRLEAYLLDADEFKIVPAINRTFISTDVEEKRLVKPKIDDDGNYLTITFSMRPSVISDSLTLTSGYLFETLQTNNVSSSVIKINNIAVSLPFEAHKNDVLSVSIVKIDTTKTAHVTLRGKNLGEFF